MRGLHASVGFFQDALLVRIESLLAARMFRIYANALKRLHRGYCPLHCVRALAVHGPAALLPGPLHASLRAISYLPRVLRLSFACTALGSTLAV